MLAKALGKAREDRRLLDPLARFRLSSATMG
jgi:hypothetical protein